MTASPTWRELCCFVDDTIIIGQITNDETSYDEEMNNLAVWCKENNPLQHHLLECNVRVHELEGTAHCNYKLHITFISNML